MTTRPLPLALLALLVACDSGKDDTAPADTDTDADADADTDTDTDTDPTGVLEGVTRLADGSPAAGGEAQLCRATCRFTDIAADGSWSFTGVETARYSVHFVVGEPGSLAEGLLPVDAVDAVTTTVPTPWTLPAWQDHTAIDAATTGTFPAGEGLELVVDGAKLLAPIGYDLAIEGVRVPEASWPDLATLAGEEVLAVWYLGVFNTYAQAPIPIVVQNDLGLSPGEQVGIRVAGYIEADWIDGGTATVASDGLTLESDAGAGLTYLTTLVLVR